MASASGVRVTPIQGKGLGMIATRAYARGDIVLVERPLVHVLEDIRPGHAGSTHYAGGDRNDALRKLLTLCRSSKGKDDVERVMKANSFVLQEGEYTRFPVRWTRVAFLQISRINHACTPSCYFAWDPSNETGTIRALRSIAPDEELTIQYGAEGAFRERQDYLKRSYDFDCRCDKCVYEMKERSEIRGHATG